MTTLRKNIFENKINRFILYVGIISILILVIINVTTRNEKKRTLEKFGVEVKATVIGIWQIPKQYPMAIYMFPIGDRYYTGEISFRYDSLAIGDEVQVIYYPKNPQKNRCINIRLK